MTLLSVIMPNYNGAATLAAAIHSVLGQTHSEFELLLVDDGSTDSSRQVVASIADSRIRLVERDHKGVSTARNEGLNLARGEYVSFLDADDRYMPDTLEFFLSAAHECPDVDLLYGDVFWERVSKLIQSLEPERIPYLSGVSPIAMFVRNSLLVRFEEELCSGLEEWDLLLRLHGRLQFKHLSRQVAVAGDPPGPRLLGDKEPTHIEGVYQDVVLRHMHRQPRGQSRCLVIARDDPPASAQVIFLMLNHLRLFWGEPFDLVFDISDTGQTGSHPTQLFGYPSYDNPDDLADAVRTGPYEELFCTRTNILLPRAFTRPDLQNGVCHLPALVPNSPAVKPQLFQSPYEPHPVIVESLGNQAARRYDHTVRFLTRQTFLAQGEARYVELSDPLLVVRPNSGGDTDRLPRHESNGRND